MSISNQTCKLLTKLLFAAAAITLCSCQSLLTSKQDNYDAPAHRPQNPNNVVIKVSLNTQMVYVMEGNRPLLVTATCIGTAQHHTPQGSFRVYNKIENKRSGSYGFGVSSNGAAYPAEASKVRGGDRYVGFPMAYWVEFSPGYGFHSGYVWNIPHSHGCLRLHPNVAPKFFALARPGTPIIIANSFPEDASLGANHRHPGPEHFLAPDPPANFLISSAAFKKPTTPLFVD